MGKDDGATKGDLPNSDTKSADLRLAKNQRAGYRGALTRFTTDMDTFITTATIDEMEASLKSIQNTHDKISTLGDQILSFLEGDEEMSEECGDRMAKDYLYFKSESTLKSAIATKRPRENTGHGATNKLDPKHAVNLPKLNLPRFGGNLTEWLAFWDVFSSTVHNSNLDNVRKFHYLKGQLDDEALHLIEGFAVVGDSYGEAVQLLKVTYGDREQLKVAHVLALLDLKEPRYKVEELANFRARMECHTRSLETLGITVSEMIVTILRRKLPLAILDKVRSFDFQEFRTTFSKEISNMQLNNCRTGNGGQAGMSGTLSMTVEARNREKGKTKKSLGVCKLCASDKHRWMSCNRFQTNEAKVARAKKLNLCTGCLAKDHGKRGGCIATYLRPCHNCQGHHFDKLCISTSTKIKDVPAGNTTTMTLGTRKDTTLLPTIMMPMEGKREIVNCRVLIDQGSQRSFIQRSTLQNLNHDVLGTETLRLQGFTGSVDRQEYDVARVSYFYRKQRQSLECVVVDQIPDYKQSGIQGVERALRAKGIQLSAIGNQTEVHILLGADHYYSVVHPGYKRECGVILIPTKFGYCLSGKVSSSDTTTLVDTVSVLRLQTTAVDSLINDAAPLEGPKRATEFDLEKLWRLDHIGIDPIEVDNDSKIALDLFEESVCYSATDQQYTVGLPWREANISLPTNYGLALGRLRALQRKLKTEPETRDAYDAILQMYVTRGFIEEVESSEPVERGRVHYLAHHCVRKDSPTTPIRIVFDCSAKVGAGPSLNDCLLTGPSLVSDLSQQLLRFRLGRYAFTSDIEKAFLMVGLSERDRDVTRFLWFRDAQNPLSPVVQYRFRVVLFGATCSQFLLNATIRKHLELAEEDTDRLLQGLYIDNLQGNCDSQEELLSLYWQARRLFAEAHLHLREWVSNCDLLNDQLQVDGTLAATQDIARNLGMIWHPGQDYLTYNDRRFAQQDVAHSKRSLLSKLSQFFDPLGLALPVTIRARILMQEIWRRGICWDDRLPVDVQDQGAAVLRDYATLCNVHLPRVVAGRGRAVLHAFCDASSTAYGVAVYVVTPLGAHLVTARAKVAPVKRVTIPKMELTAMLLLGRLVGHINVALEKDLSLDSVHVWSDSQIALNWVHSNKTLPVYVRNRVDEIRSLLPNAIYHYVHTSENPSDLITRGITASRLQKSTLWWHGPPWLLQEEMWTEWEAADVGALSLEAVAVSSLTDDNVTPIPMYEWARVGAYNKLVRIFSLVVCFITTIRDKAKGMYKISDTGLSLAELSLTSTALKTAEIAIIKRVQTESFSKEAEYLRRNKPSIKPNLVQQLRLYLDNGLIRCEGRLERSDMPFETTNPILMPSDHHVTNLLVARAHQSLAHYGIHHVVSNLRQVWWIPRIRQVVRRVLKRCVTCRRLKGKPYSTGPAPPLPDFRVNQLEPFRVVGLDYTGALKTKDQDKVYVLLFTCTTTRAVHLERCDDMTTETFMLAFRRFCARRSIPQLLISDNAPTFHQASNYLKELQEDAKIISFLGERRCEWRFIPARAPWFGGMWERCVGIVKSGLKSIIGRALVRKVELDTVLTEVEAIVNSRPLTYVYTDLQEPLPLTPAHLLYGRELTPFPSDLQAEGELEDPSLYSRSAVTRRYRYVTKIIEDFRKRWKMDYLLALRERSNRDNNNVYTPSVGDVVLIHEECPRLFWRLGRVLEVYEGQDHIDRVALVKTSTGNTVRPVARLYMMELNDESNTQQQTDSAGSEDIDNNQTPSDVSQPRIGTRSRRAASNAVSMWRRKIASGQL